MTATAAVRTAAATNPPHLRPRRKAGIRSEESGKTTYRPMDNFGFLKVAAAVPHVRVGDCDFNTERIAAMAEEAAQRGLEIVAFPELAVTAYTCADLLLQPALLDAADEALARLVKATRNCRWSSSPAPPCATARRSTTAPSFSRRAAYWA